MMAEIVAESLICNACGAEIRGGALYCYNCGKTSGETPDVTFETTSPVIPSDNGWENQPAAAKPEKLRSAASLRKRAKVFNSQPTEYTWEKRIGPSFLFVAATIILTIFAAILLFLALYLR